MFSQTRIGTTGCLSALVVLAAATPASALQSGENYLVVDLSGGTAATNYPVTFLNGVPPGGWTDEYKTDRLVLRKIPAGTFSIGSPTDELGRYDNETSHPVTLTRGYYIGVFEVTQRQWERVMGNRPSYFNNAAYYASRPVEKVSYYDVRENPANSDDPASDWPANGAVNASSFMGKLRAKTGLATFDLPTESQWEYACRAGTTTALNSGKNLTSAEQDANMAEVGRYYYNGGSGYSQSCATNAGTAAAGSYLPNAWGLYDMHGNVWELCLDWYGAYPGAATDPAGAASGSDRVARGGGWGYDAGYCRSAGRFSHYYPHDQFYNYGFRAARTLPANTYSLTVVGGAGGGEYGATTAVAVAADAPPGQPFIRWTVSPANAVLGAGFSVTQATVTVTKPAYDVTLTAVFEGLANTVIFDAQGGTSSPTAATVTNGLAYGTLPVPVRLGYTFGGWWTGANGTGAEVTAATAVAITAAQTLYAGWTANAYTVTFDPGPCEIDPPPPKSVNYDAAYGALPTLTRTGYTFGGWWTGDHGAGAQINAATAVSTAADHTLHAKWTINSYTLTYAAGANGTIEGESPQSVNHGSDGSKVEAVPGTGYRFTGWSDGYADNKRTDQNVAHDISVTALFGGVGFATGSAEVSENAGAVTLTVNGGIPAGASSVNVYIQPCTATTADYTVPPAAQLTLTWMAGEVGSKNVTIPIKADALVEDDETFHVLLGSPTHCMLGEPMVCKVTITDANRGDTLADALDNTLLKWTTGGTPAWVPQGAITSDGEDAAASGAMASNKVSHVGASVTGTGTLSFAWSVSGWGTLRLLDGSKVLAAVTNDTAWQTRNLALTQIAAHTLKWEFTQGGSTHARAYLDRVVWLPGGRAGVAVTAAVSNPLGGTASGTGVYYAGAKVPLNAKPRPGWLFTGWAPANLFAKPLVAAQTVTVSNDPVVATANFVKMPIVAALPYPPEGGMVTGAGVYLPGAKVTLTAKPAANNTFLHWEDGSQAPARSLVMPNANVTVSARFGLTSGVRPPVIVNPGPQQGMVGVAFSLPLDIESDSFPTVTITGLPSGLAYDAATRSIAGVPRAVCLNKQVRVVTRNANSVTSAVTFSLTVEPLPAWAQGRFEGDAYVSGRVNGVAFMLVTPQGKISGKLPFEGKTLTFSGDRMVLYPANLDNPWPYAVPECFIWVQVQHEAKALDLFLFIRPMDISGSLGVSCPSMGWVSYAVTEYDVRSGYGILSRGDLYRNVWTEPIMISALSNRYVGYYTAALSGGDEYGSGYLTLTVDRTGGVKTAGKLADGTAVSMSGTLRPDRYGRFWTALHMAPNGYKGGRFSGAAEFVKGPDKARVTVRLLDNVPLMWESRNPQATHVYGAGFSRHLRLSGGWYDTVGNLYAYYANRALTVGTDGEAPVPEVTVGTDRVSSAWWNPDGIALAVSTNRLGVMTGLAVPKAGVPVDSDNNGEWDYSATNTVGLTIGLTRATGVFMGSFKAWFDYGATHAPRSVAYEGVLTPEREDTGDGAAGRGFFLWADKSQYLDPQGKPVPYSFSWSYDLKILLSETP